MRRAPKHDRDPKKSKLGMSDRGRAILERIRTRREQIRERTGVLCDSAELIREERARRF